MKNHWSDRCYITSAPHHPPKSPRPVSVIERVLQLILSVFTVSHYQRRWVGESVSAVFLGEDKWQCFNIPSGCSLLYWLFEEVWRRGGHFWSDLSMAGLYSCIFFKTEVLGTYIPAKRYQSCNVHLASGNPIRNNQCIGLVQVFSFSNLQQYITNIQIFKTIPNPGI